MSFSTLRMGIVPADGGDPQWCFGPSPEAVYEELGTNRPARMAAEVRCGGGVLRDRVQLDCLHGADCMGVAPCTRST